MLTAGQLLAEIQRLYGALQALPWQERPDSRRSSLTRASPTYLALEGQIRALADRYKYQTSDQARVA